MIYTLKTVDTLDRKSSSSWVDWH